MMKIDRQAQRHILLVYIASFCTLLVLLYQKAIGVKSESGLGVIELGCIGKYCIC